MAKKKKAEKKYTADEIISLVDKKMNSTPVSDLITQMEEDFDLFALKEYQAEPDHQSYTSPSPRNDFLKVFHGVNKADLTWQIMVPEDAEDKEREAANKGEALLTGIIDLADRQLRKTGEPSIREGFNWYGCARGVAGLKCLIYTRDNGDTAIDIRPIDSMHMAWEKGAEGLVWWAYLYNISAAEALDRYDEVIGDEGGVIIDFFTRSINAIVLKTGSTDKADGLFIKKPTPHELERIPAGVFFAGGMPTVYDKNGDQKLKYRAQSVYNASRGVYEPMNKQISFIMDTAEKSVAGTLVYQSQDGTKDIKGDPFGSYKVVKLAADETLKALDPPNVPQESAVILSKLDRDKQESTVPYPIGYGIDPGAHSGAALSMMNDNMRSVYSPFTGMVCQGFQWLCEEILAQFKKKGKKIKLPGYSPNGKFFVQEFNPSDIQDDWYVQVKCEPKLPRDEAGELQMAISATQPRANGLPLLSWQTAVEKIIQLQNPEAEKTRIERETANDTINKNPIVQIRRLAATLAQSEYGSDKELAKELLSTIPQPQQQGQPQGQPQGQAPQSGAGNQQQAQQAAMQELQAVAQQLGLPPEQVARMTPAQVQQALAQRR